MSPGSIACLLIPSPHGLKTNHPLSKAMNKLCLEFSGGVKKRFRVGLHETVDKALYKRAMEKRYLIAAIDMILKYSAFSQNSGGVTSWSI